MNDYLKNLIIQDVWCDPQQDNQQIIAPIRITPDVGAINSFNLMTRVCKLPVSTVYYHVYQVGQCSPSSLGLAEQPYSWLNETWYDFSRVMAQMDLFIDIYTDTGVCIPRFNSWYMLTNERNLIIAIPIDTNIPLDYKNQIYLRFYTNGYYSVKPSTTANIYNTGLVVSSLTQLNTLIDTYIKYSQYNGYCYCYVNGLLVKDISPYSVKVNDAVEMVYDSSVKKIVDISINSLKKFNSTLDNMSKYIIHYPSDSTNTIDYHDDIDIYVYIKTTGGYYGYYLNRNNSSSVRMVTHRDYSIAISDVQRLTANFASIPSSTSNYYIKLIIRNGGYYNRQLTYESNRIVDLYKLPDLQLSLALSNISIPNWSADTLESSDYCKIMRSNWPDITLDMVENALGYNAIAKLAGDNPIPIVQGKATLPYELRTNVTVYEYDTDGYLLGWHPGISSDTYTPSNPKTTMIEIIHGKGSDIPDVNVGVYDIIIPSGEYRVYLGNNSTWVEITGSSQYVINNNKIDPVLSNPDSIYMVRGRNKFLAYDTTIRPVNGYLSFTLTESNWTTGTFKNGPMPVPMGDLDIFLNGKSLIMGIDYIVLFPIVYILNTKYLVQPYTTSKQSIHVRYTGFCDNTLSIQPLPFSGFINSNAILTLEDKVSRTTADGKLVTTIPNTAGLPYQVKDVFVPLNNIINQDTNTFRAAAQAIDNTVITYLTSVMATNPTIPITDKYPLYSPFMAAIIHDITTGVLSETVIQEVVTITRVKNLCTPYIHLLIVDPTNNVEINNIDLNSVKVLPVPSLTPLSMTSADIRFLKNVSLTYLNSLVVF